MYLEDNTQAWILNSDGQYELIKRKDSDEEISAQKTLLQAMSKLAMT